MAKSGLRSEALGRVLLLLSAFFLVLGGVFVLAPASGARLYGLHAQAGSALFYVRVVGLRDLALAAYLAGLTLASQRPALVILLAATIVIPAGDMILLAASGAGSPFHYALHLASLLCFAVLALWMRGSMRRNSRDD